MLLTGFGFAVGAIVLSRSGKPHVIDCMMRQPSAAHTTRLGMPERLPHRHSTRQNCAATPAAGKRSV
jgi:hypothetical protein